MGPVILKKMVDFCDFLVRVLGVDPEILVKIGEDRGDLDLDFLHIRYKSLIIMNLNIY
jgi:hypothetical protein